MKGRILFCTLLLAASGCWGDGPVSPRLIEPQCVLPAPLNLQNGESAIANTYTVLYHADVADAEAVTAALEAKYRFEARISWSNAHGFGGFGAVLSPVRVALLRCEPSVESIEQSIYFYPQD